MNEFVDCALDIADSSGDNHPRSGSAYVRPSNRERVAHYGACMNGRVAFEVNEGANHDIVADSYAFLNDKRAMKGRGGGDLYRRMYSKRWRHLGEKEKV